MSRFHRFMMSGVIPVVRRRAVALSVGLSSALLLVGLSAVVMGTVDTPNIRPHATAGAHAVGGVRYDTSSFGGDPGDAAATEVRKQSAAQLRAAARKRIQGAEKNNRQAESCAARGADRERAARSLRDKKQRQAVWVLPVDHFSLGAPYGLGGRLWARTHSGQDFVVPTGTAVRAVHGGTVVAAGWGGAFGQNIVIRHSARVYTQYGHLSRLDVHEGQFIGAGAVIGRSGSTGNSTGPHLHFEVRTTPRFGSSVDPLHFLRAHGVRI